MSEFQLGVLVYVPLQIISFLLLPKWWRLAAIPALIAAPGIFFNDKNIGDAFATMWMIIACAYLVVIWAIVGVVKLVGMCLDNRQNE